MDRVVKIPGPDHPISISADDAWVVVRVGGQVIADTRASVLLVEAGHDPVRYIPRSDVDMALLERTATGSYCPYKGDASYFSIPSGGAASVDAVWSYEAPFPAMGEIGGYLAFYPDRVGDISVEV